MKGMLFVCLVWAGMAAVPPAPTPFQYVQVTLRMNYPSPSPLPPPIPTPHPVQDRDEQRMDENSPRIRAGFVECPCSISGRGFALGRVLPNGTESLGLLNAVADEKTTKAFARAEYDGCVKEHGHEACVNWDAANVFSGDVAFCVSDRETGRNLIADGVGMWRTVGACDDTKATRSHKTSLRNGQFLTLHDIEDKAGMFEGCVAVEHLKKTRFLQHPIHLRRSVLCHDGFCATPNHALIVDGVWTSMRRLCATRWRCTSDTKLVNNLSVFDRTRLSVSGIVITPYDVRVPVFVTWLLQFVEHLTVVYVGLWMLSHAPVRFITF